MAGDQHIIGADLSAKLFQVGADFASMFGGGFIERQHSKSRGETFDLAPVLLWPR